jgi:D-3-phosphoglycerate dehydrogenase
MKKVYVIDQYHPAGLDLLTSHAEVVRWDDARVADWQAEADALMVRLTPLGEREFARAKKLKLVVKQGVGVDSIDLEAAKRHGIAVCNTPGANSEAVAELALALALAVARRVAESDRVIRSGKPVRRANLLGIELFGKAVGVIGMGNIGTRIARKFHAAFDARIVAYDPYVPPTRWPDIPHERAPSLEALLEKVDVLTVHVPLTAETKPLIGPAEIARLKKRAILVNTARGGVVDEKALYEALRSGHLYGAGIDVFVTEPPRHDDPLMTLENVVATPHSGGGTEENQVKGTILCAEEVLRHLRGEPLLNPLT